MDHRPHFLLMFILVPAAQVLAQAPDYGIEWRTVGAAGNVAAQPGDYPNPSMDRPLGSVGYEYRIARTEVTNAQYLEFVIAYTTVYPPTSHSSLALLGLDIRERRVGTRYEYSVLTELAQHGATMGWNYAAMYCNWLTNRKAVTAAAFANGAYDASTFPPGGSSPQLVHTPGASFWLASNDEWTKAMFYDPNKFGPGAGGYNLYPTGSDIAPVSGPPGSGAQTGYGVFEPYDHPYPVGSYPAVMSPWGLLDGSGGVAEWCEGYVPGAMREIRGTSEGPGGAGSDRLDALNWMGYYDWLGGIRLVSPVPAPLTTAPLAALLFLRRRRP